VHDQRVDVDDGDVALPHQFNEGWQALNPVNEAD
jgi:hypothetical protein